MSFLGHISLWICVSQVGKHISLRICLSGLGGTDITRDMCFPGRETHITRDMCSGEHISRGNTYHCDVTLI